MRLALLTDDWRPTGGVVGHVRLVAAALAAEGHEVLVLHAGTSGDVDEPPPPGVTVHAIPASLRDSGRSANHAAVAPVLRALSDFGAEVAHVHACTNFAVEDAVRVAVPTLKTVHTLDVCPSGTKFHHATGHVCVHDTSAACLPRQVYLRCTLSKRPQVLWRGYQYAEAVAARLRTFGDVAVASEFVRQLLIRSHVNGAHITVIPYFTPRTAVSGPPTSRTVLFVGRVTPEKGVDVLLDALTRVPGEWRLVIVGDGIAMSDTRERIAAAGVTARVVLRGWLTGDALSDAYRDAAVVVVPSRWPEPFGIVGIEAMAHGRPVVAAAVGGIPEWLRDGEGGALVPPGDAPAMAAAITTMLDQPEVAMRVAARGRARVAQEFSTARHMAALLPVYERVRARGV